jgi:hypothetical protein
MGHRLWEKVRCQHKLSAPSSSSAITHQTSKGSSKANFREFQFHALGGIGYSSRRGLPEMSMKNLVPNSLCP